MYGIRKKQSKYRDVINQDVVILDDILSQLLVMNANEDGIIYDALMTYVKSDTPKMGKCWNGKKAFYFMPDRSRNPASTSARWSRQGFLDWPDRDRLGQSGNPASTLVLAGPDRVFRTGPSQAGPIRTKFSGPA
ncbi:hypothetical protein TIFTF001_049652 [Ficus carica]|uniref:Uncharacterized protein n=1 Tax=Ficus carica TaxID=3494 RepID=A0AA87ZDG5_FICCA|nr:hypothetical protein TIFTF001_049652 [Ficus carica]